MSWGECEKGRHWKVDASPPFLLSWGGLLSLEFPPPHPPKKETDRELVPTFVPTLPPVIQP